MGKYIYCFVCMLGIAPCLSAEEPADYKLEVMDFTELKVTDNINVDYHCSADSAGWAYFTCDPSISSMLLFSNNKSCLHIQTATDGAIVTGLPTIHVYSSSLAKAENASDSTMRILSDVPVKSFSGKVIGNGTLIVNNVEASVFEASIATGKGHIVLNNCKSQRAKLSNVGTGPIEAGGLVSKDVKAILFGTGDVDCTVNGTLSVYGAGSGKVYYGGNPEKVSNRSLGVKAFPVGEAKADDTEDKKK